MKASSIENPCSSTSIRAASSDTSSRASSKASAVACGIQRSASTVTGHVACLPFRRPNRIVTSPAISTPVQQTSPATRDAGMSPTTTIPPARRTGEVLVVPADRPGEAVVRVEAAGPAGLDLGPGTEPGPESQDAVFARERVLGGEGMEAPGPGTAAPAGGGWASGGASTNSSSTF